jgi:undecaprenyl-diphosphatase
MFKLIKDNKFLFWQPPTDWFKVISQKKHGSIFLVFFNYFLWLFLFYVSYKLIKQNTNLFWQLLVATVFSEVIEKLLKKQVLWRRPIHLRDNCVPNSMIQSCYKHGSFPSGHSIKIAFFFVFILQNSGSFPVLPYSVITLFLAFSRVILGLHYPIDLLGGFIIGGILGMSIGQINFPIFLIEFIRPIFNFIFFIK